MTDPIRTALESAAVVLDNKRWAQLHGQEVVLLSDAIALATPPASPEPERCAECGMPSVSNQHVPVDRCTVYPSEASGCVEPERHHPFTPPTPPESAAPEGLHKCWCQHGYAADSQGIPPMESPTPPESAEALRDDARCAFQIDDIRPGRKRPCNTMRKHHHEYMSHGFIAAARATPPLTVEYQRLRDAVGRRDVDEALRALAALEQGR